MQLQVDISPYLNGSKATGGFGIIKLLMKGGMAMNMAYRIKYLRKRQGLSQEELADKIGVSRQAVSKWESEQSVPDLKNIIIMSDFFKTTTDYILKGKEPVSVTNKKTFYPMYQGFVLIFATLFGIWSFTANRFRTIESIFIVLAGAVIGLGVSFIFQVLSNLSKKQM